jgi:hypothetical protein
LSSSLPHHKVAAVENISCWCCVRPKKREKMGLFRPGSKTAHLLESETKEMRTADFLPSADAKYAAFVDMISQ